MFVFIFDSITNLTSNYHSGGGLVVIAESIERAIELAQAEDVSFDDDEIAAVKSYELAKEAEPQVFIFPDAGCC